MKDKSIYTIFTCEKLEDSFPDNYGASCVPGWYADLDECRKAVINNRDDIWECCYDYACIEKIDEGLYNVDSWCEWYHYDIKTGKYELIKRPEFDKYFIGRSMA